MSAAFQGIVCEPSLALTGEGSIRESVAASREVSMNVFEYLDQSNAHYAVSEHAPTYSAQVMAAEEHEKGRYVAKPVIVKSEGNLIMCVLAAPDKVVFDKLRDYLGTDDVTLALEDETREIFADCEEGAEPPFGRLYGLRTIMDSSLEDDDHIIFQAGTHDKAVRMNMSDYLALAQPEIVDFAYRPEQRL
jgi:Ala-tRNA(Pro) deacylase